MHTHVFLRFVIRKPAKTDAIAVVRLPIMRMRRLDRRDDKIIRCDKPGLAHHIAFMRPIAVDGDQQRPLASEGQPLG